jgi:hypothetical protein
MPLFRRSDGTLVKNLDPVRRMMPLIMRGRNESVVYHNARYDVTCARIWLRNFNRSRAPSPHATLFHLVMFAIGRIMHERPALNRFVSGGRIYQRKGVWLTFAFKKEMTDEAPLGTLKLPFAENCGFPDFVDQVTGAVQSGRSGGPSAIERELSFLFHLPYPLLRAVLAAGRWLDRINLLPGSLIESDPMYASCFFANLGSINIENAFHHLNEYGTCTAFGVVGKAAIEMQLDHAGKPVRKDILPVQWSFDERVKDGFYCLKALEGVRQTIEDPETCIPLSRPAAAACERPLSAGQPG